MKSRDNTVYTAPWSKASQRHLDIKNGLQVIGKSQSEWTIKIHRVATDRRRAPRFSLSSGQAGGQATRPRVVHGPVPAARLGTSNGADEGNETCVLARKLGFIPCDSAQPKVVQAIETLPPRLPNNKLSQAQTVADTHVVVVVGKRESFPSFTLGQHAKLDISVHS